MGHRVTPVILTLLNLAFSLFVTVDDVTVETFVILFTVRYDVVESCIINLMLSCTNDHLKTT